MIETHVVNAFLRQDLFSTPWYTIINFINGLIAPSFLFLAGYSFAIVASRKWDDFLAMNSVFRKQLSRYLLILLIGYSLHVPNYSFDTLFKQLRWDTNSLFWGTDILHSIAASLIIMLLLVLIIRKKEAFFIFLGAAGVAISFSTAFVHSLPITDIIAAPFAGYFKRILWSQFPLFPWMAYLFLGAFTSYLWTKSKEKNKETQFFSYITYGGIVLCIIVPVIWYGRLSFSPVFPQFFFMKLGIVLMLLAMFQWLETRKQINPEYITTVGQESLIAYTAHIIFIYGVLWNWGRVLVPASTVRTHPPLEVILMTLFLIVATTTLSIWWHRMKEKNLSLARKLHFALWMAVLILFIIKK